MGAKVLTGPSALKAWDKVLQCSRAYAKAWFDVQLDLIGEGGVRSWGRKAFEALEVMALAERDLQQATIKWAKTQKEGV